MRKHITARTLYTQKTIIKPYTQNSKHTQSQSQTHPPPKNPKKPRHISNKQAFPPQFNTASKAITTIKHFEAYLNEI